MPAVILNGRPYNINITPADRIRRTLYFQNGSTQLTADERTLLDDLGFDPILELSLRTHLPDFFNQLPKCQSNTSLVLDNSCQIPHFIMWSILFHNHTNTLRRMRINRSRAATLSPGGTATVASATGALTPVSRPPGSISGLFQLIVPGARLPPAPTGTPPPGTPGLFHVLRT